MSAPFAVRMRGISKRYGPATVLENVNLEVSRGSLHAIVGENGAGKTTLMKILYGAARADSGAIEVEGNETALTSTADAHAHGVGMVSQHYAIIGELSNLQNLILGVEGSEVLSYPHLKSRASGLAERMGFEFSWDDKSESLSPAGAQKLEILKLLWRDSRIMILDEPTAMLSPSDSDALFDSLRALSERGATILLVTHRVSEVLEHCERVTVLRGGRDLGTHETKELTPTSLSALMIGEALHSQDRVRAVSTGKVRLEVVDLNVPSGRGNLAVNNATLAVQAGEIVGIAGVDGNGQKELLEAILGLRRLAGGTISVDGKKTTGETVRQRIARGLRILPEDRQEEAIIERWSLTDNSILGLQANFADRGWLDWRRVEGWTTKVVNAFQTKSAGHDSPISSLSGGNQQRFVVGRALESDPTVILAFQPARGLDIKATAAIFGRLRELCAKGCAVLLVSFELDELLQHCDRIVVMRDGQLSVPLAQTRGDIGARMVGAA